MNFIVHWPIEIEVRFFGSKTLVSVTQGEKIDAVTRILKKYVRLTKEYYGESALADKIQSVNNYENLEIREEISE